MVKTGSGIASSQIIGREEGETLEFAGVTGRLTIDGRDTAERFAVACFPHIPAHTLAAPLHRHQNEDEYSYTLEGTLTLQLGDSVVRAPAGTCARDSG